MRKWIQFPRQEGVVSRQAHADFPEEAIYEREAGREGFFGPASHFHHKHPPTAWESWKGPLRPQAFNLKKMQAPSVSPFDAPKLLRNSHCEMRFWVLETGMNHLVRNADGDVLLFVHRGDGDLWCDYGHLSLKTGDYVMVPRGTMWRIDPAITMEVLIIEATNDSFQLPDKGMLGNHAIFDPAILDCPSINDRFLAQQGEEPWDVHVKRCDTLSTVRFPFNPLDAIGWHGDLSVVRVNWRDIRPIMSHRYHLPPSVHTTFVARRFVVCTFVPRPIESDPGALKVPFYHNNDDYDEVLFYHDGDFFSRDNIEPGMMTFHPSGFTHGPHPKALEAGLKHANQFTNEVAVMIDTRDPLEVDSAMQLVEQSDYVDSWKVGDSK